MITAPLNKLLSKDAKFEWNDKWEEAFKELKSRLSTPPIPCGTNWTLPFHVHTDASDIGLGVVLRQKDGKLEYAIYFISKSLSSAELHYTVTEKEFLAVVFALNKFRHYLGGYPTIVHTNHSTIKYLINKPTRNHWIVKWLLLLQEFDVTFVDKLGKENVVANFWGRLQVQIGDQPIDDSFPNEHLFAISTFTPWFVDIVNFLVAGVLPSHCTKGQKANLIRKSIFYKWQQECLYRIGLDSILRRCIREDEVLYILRAYHSELGGGHYRGQRTTMKILNVGYYWPSVFKDSLHLQNLVMFVKE